MGTLAGDLDSSPFDDEAYPPPSHSRGRPDRHSEFDWGWYRGSGPLPFSALPPAGSARGCPSRHFGENQLSPCSIGISPLPTAHPSRLQPTLVRASTPCYRGFTLAMGSSHGFGSTACHSRTWHTRFRYGSAFRLTSRQTVTRRVILQKARHHSGPITRTIEL